MPLTQLSSSQEIQRLVHRLQIQPIRQLAHIVAQATGRPPLEVRQELMARSIRAFEQEAENIEARAGSLRINDAPAGAHPNAAPATQPPLTQGLQLQVPSSVLMALFSGTRDALLSDETTPAALRAPLTRWQPETDGHRTTQVLSYLVTRFSPLASMLGYSRSELPADCLPALARAAMVLTANRKDTPTAIEEFLNEAAIFDDALASSSAMLGQMGYATGRSVQVLLLWPHVTAMARTLVPRALLSAWFAQGLGLVGDLLVAALDAAAQSAGAHWHQTARLRRPEPNAEGLRARTQQQVEGSAWARLLAQTQHAATRHLLLRGLVVMAILQAIPGGPSRGARDIADAFTDAGAGCLLPALASLRQKPMDVPMERAFLLLTQPDLAAAIARMPSPPGQGMHWSLLKTLQSPSTYARAALVGLPLYTAWRLVDGTLATHFTTSSGNQTAEHDPQAELAALANQAVGVVEHLARTLCAGVMNSAMMLSTGALWRWLSPRIDSDGPPLSTRVWRHLRGAMLPATTAAQAVRHQLREAVLEEARDEAREALLREPGGDVRAGASGAVPDGAGVHPPKPVRQGLHEAPRSTPGPLSHSDLWAPAAASRGSGSYRAVPLSTISQPSDAEPAPLSLCPDGATSESEL